MALKVSTAKSGTVVLGKNYGFQGSTYNPQQTAPGSTIQNTMPASTLQGSTYNPQQTVSANILQPAQIASRIALAQQQAAAAAAQAKALIKVQFQSKLDNKVASNLSIIKAKTSDPNFQVKVRLGKVKQDFKIVQPEMTEYDKAYAAAYRSALDDYEKQRKPGKQNFFSSVLDKVSLGQDRRDISARQYAESQANKLMDTGFKSYEKKINDYNSKLAKAQADVNRALTTMSQADYDLFLKRQQGLIDKEYQSLIAEGAAYDGRIAAYGKNATAPLTSFGAKAITSLVKIASDENPIWKYTIGSGDQNKPSLVTAPGRAVNFVNNLIDPKGKKNYYQGVVKNGIDQGKNAWQATFNQRNFNMAQPKQVSKEKFLSDLYNKLHIKESGRSQTQWYNEKKEQLDTAWSDSNRTAKESNYTAEFLADPLLAVGYGAKGIKAGAKFLAATDLAKTSRVGNWTAAAAEKLRQSGTLFKSKLAENPAAKWLMAEHQSPADKFFETRQKARDLSRAQQDQFLKQIQVISEKVKANPRYDMSVIDDLKALSPGEREVLQRMTTEGGFAFRDYFSRAGRGMKPWRDKMQSLAKRYTDFTEQMKLSDEVNKTSYGRATKKIYSPRTVWTKDLSEYDFRLKRAKGVQSGDDFLHGVIDRFFKSNLDEVMAGKHAKYQKYSKQLKDVSANYERSFSDARATVESAQKEYRRGTTGVGGWVRNRKDVRSDVSFGRSVFNTGRNTLTAPTRLWKKSVLKYRPAWTVNNVLYNTQAAVLAGGPRALVEQAKMLNPRYYRRAMEESRPLFGSNLGKEIGGNYRGRNPAKRFDSKLTKFYTGVEDWSRVAAGRAALKKGLTPAQAQKRVNRYLFDYKTRNWERPIKAVVPFWAWNKNLARAAFTMPVDRPLAAMSYNRVDRYQQTQYDAEFEPLRPQLKKLGYSDQEIDGMKEENAKYFRGRLKVGDRWMSTPFNAFSDRGLSQLGINPWLQTAKEVATATDRYDRPLAGKESGFVRRIMSKFPQLELLYGADQKRRVDSGELKPLKNYIGKSGHDGFGLGKQQQGYDPTKPNYVASMDPRTKLGANALSFLGVPGSMQFDKTGFLDRKKLQKVTAEYFKLDTAGLPFDQAEAKRTALFKRYGMSSDEFYNGVLSKYDSENTKQVKQLKRDAAAKNKTLFDEYGRQPQGSRNLWVTSKLRQLNDEGYFNDNPYLKSFKYATPTTIAKADRQQLVQSAVKSGDWSAYRKKYGLSQKQKDLELAKRTGDWTAYEKNYGTNRKSSPHQFDGKFFKSADSMAKYKEGKFWQEYAHADKASRKKLLAANPQYDRMSQMSPVEWLAYRNARKAELKDRAMGFGNIATLTARNRDLTKPKAARFQAARRYRQKKVVFLPS